MVIGAVDIGRMSRKNTLTLAAPSSSAASSTSREMPRKNWRRKNTANGVMNMVGRAMPNRVSTRPSCLMQHEVRQQREDRRDHQAGQEEGEDRSRAPAQPREGVRRHRGEEHLPDGDERGDDDGVEQVAPEVERLPGAARVDGLLPVCRPKTRSKPPAEVCTGSRLSGPA